MNLIKMTVDWVFKSITLTTKTTKALCDIEVMNTIYSEACFLDKSQNQQHINTELKMNTYDKVISY